MTKKSNSLILRLGLSNFWINRSNNNKVLWQRFQTESLLINELKKVRFLFIEAFFSSKSIQVFFCNDFIKTFRRSYVLKKYLIRNSNLKKVVEKFGFSERFIVKRFKFKQKRIKFSCIKRFLILKLVFFKFLRFLFLCFRKKKKAKSKLKNIVLNFYKKIRCLQFLFKSYKLVNQFKFICHRFSRKHFRRRFGFLKLNVLELKILMTIYLNVGFLIQVFLNNVRYVYGLRQTHKLPRHFKSLGFFCFIISEFKSSRLIVRYLSAKLSKVQNHFWILRRFMSCFQRFYLEDRFTLNGLLVRVSGKLQGKMRKSKYQCKIGIMHRQILIIPMSYFFGISITRFGILSIKVWLSLLKWK